MSEPLALAGCGAGLAALVLASRSSAGPALQAFRLTFPRDTRPEQIVAFARSLSGLLPPWWRRLLGSPAVIFEAVSSEHGISHRVLAPPEQAAFVLAQLQAALPGTRVENDEVAGLVVRSAAELRVSSSRVPLRTDQPQATAAGLLATLQPRRAGECSVIQWVLAPAPSGRLRGNVPLPSLLGELTLGGAHLQASLPIEQARAEREKRSEPEVHAVCRLGVKAGSPAREAQLLRRMIGAFHAGNAPGVSFRVRWLPSKLVARAILRRQAGSTSLLNAKEVAGFLAIPIGDLQLPGLTLGSARQLAPSSDLPRRGRVIGRATFPGAERLLALSVADSLRHLHVIGPTGVGKSTLLLRLIAGDMAAGRTVIVVDPKGDLVADALERVPADRVGDVILLDPTDADRPVGLNLLSGAGESPELVTDQVVSVFHHLYTAFWGPRTDDILRAALLTLAAEPGMTLVEVPLLLTNESFRRRLVAAVDDPVALEPFWAWYEAMSPAERAQAIGPVLNKLRTFLLRRRLRNVIGQAESTFELETVLSERKILLVSLRKGLLGEDAAALLGSAVLARLWHAVQGRAALPPKARTPVFAYVDEFQDYLNLPTSLADVLAQARAYGFGLTLAHQHLGQLPPLVRTAVLANARSKVVFQTAAADAQTLAREFAPHLAATDLQSLGPYEAVVAAAAGNRVLPPASMATLPPCEPTGEGAKARELSRLRYGRDRAAVERAMGDRLSTGPATGDIKRRRRP
jgi:Type IV secretion-system coupling protein DNA-binding domain